jgi:hypothetical protein
MSDSPAPDHAENPGNEPAETRPPVVSDQPVDEQRRYDANLKLIRRRLADQAKTSKPRWWWLGR